MCPYERLLHYCGVACASGVRVLARVVRCHALDMHIALCAPWPDTAVAH